MTGTWEASRGGPCLHRSGAPGDACAADRGPQGRLIDEVRSIEPAGALKQQLWRDQNPTRRRDLDAFTRREHVKRAAVTALTRRLAQAGVPLLLGTDASAPGMFPGKSAHLELEELVAAGLTPFEALVAGTANAGRFVETRMSRVRAPHLGTIQRHGVADLLLVRQNPLDDVRHLSNLEGVMTQGRWWARD